MKKCNYFEDHNWRINIEGNIVHKTCSYCGKSTYGVVDKWRELR